jgi:hypothetical protein
VLVASSADLVVADKRVGVLVLLEIAQRVVDAAMDRFVSADVVDQILHRPLPLGHMPVSHGHIGDLEVRVRPFWQRALFDLLDASGICVDSLLLEVADESVGDPGRDKVADEDGVEENALRAEDHCLHEPSGLAHLHKGEKVHSLVVRLLQEGLDPAVVTFETAKATEMSQHAGNHSGDTSDGLEKDEANELLLSVYILIQAFHQGGTYPLRFSQWLGSESSRWVLLVHLLLAPDAGCIIHSPSDQVSA